MPYIDINMSQRESAFVNRIENPHGVSMVNGSAAYTDAASEARTVAKSESCIMSDAALASATSRDRQPMQRSDLYKYRLQCRRSLPRACPRT